MSEGRVRASLLRTGSQDGRLILERCEAPKSRSAPIRILRRKGKHKVGISAVPVSNEDVQEFINQFP
jgi:hypothetical protein